MTEETLSRHNEYVEEKNTITTKETLSRRNPRRSQGNRSRQNFQVATENAIWARILGIHNVASNLGPKLLGLYK